MSCTRNLIIFSSAVIPFRLESHFNEALRLNLGVDEVEFVCSSQTVVDMAREKFPEKVKAKKKKKKAVGGEEAGAGATAAPLPANKEHSCWKDLAKILQGVRVRFVSAVYFVFMKYDTDCSFLI